MKTKKSFFFGALFALWVLCCLVQADTFSPLAADLEGSGRVNFKDFAILANQWLQTPDEPSADIAPVGGLDNFVDELDLQVLAEQWLGVGIPKVEIGIVSNVNDSWTEVTLSQNYDSIVVVATANYDSGDDPAVVRIKDAGIPYANKFKIRADEAENGTMNGIDVHYMVMEEGVYNVIDHGTKMEVRKIRSTVTDYKANWTGQELAYVNSYTTPVVLGQVMSYGGSDFSTFWCQGSLRVNPPDSFNLKVGKTVSEDIIITRSDETLGIIIIEADINGTMKDVVVNGTAAADTKYVANVGSDSIQGFDDSPPYGYSLGTHLSSASVGIAATAGVDESDGGWPILYGVTPLSSTTLNLAIDEDNVIDSERNHTTEQVAYIVFE